MEQDKVLKKAIRIRRSESLPYGFDKKVMHQVFRAAEQKKKRSFILGLSLISMVSAVMIVLAVFILTYYFSFSMHLTLPQISNSPETKTLFGFSCYIAIVILALLGMDGYFRSLRKKRHEKHS